MTSYRGRHFRVARKRGPASQFPCVNGCGREAQDWSQIHGTTGEDPAHYEPRCRSCHVKYDKENPARGEAHGSAKLTEAKVRGIYVSVGATQRELAELHGVHHTTIKDIRLGRLWKHITGGRKAGW